jgi:hypothetical protein
MDVVTNAPQVAAEVAELGVGARLAVHGVVNTYTMLAEAAVKREASTPRSVPRPGPGGPRLLTGTYNRSITHEVQFTGTASEGTVGTNAVQGRRLEFGFSGSDSAGRHYNQKAYEHFAPGLATVDGPFQAAVLAAALKGV